MFNLFLRVKRNGEWLQLDLAETTVEERHEHFATLPPPALLRWLNAVCEAHIASEREKQPKAQNDICSVYVGPAQCTAIVAGFLVAWQNF